VYKTGLPVLRESKMADVDEALQIFLEFADLQSFQEELYKQGIKKYDHLQDIEEDDLKEIGRIEFFY
jgi:hypothetical protein